MDLSQLSPPRWLSPAVGLHLEDAVADLQHRHVEGAAAEVEHEDGLVGRGLLVEPVGERGRGGLVDDALDLQAGDLAGVLRGLALVVVEVGRDRDHGRVDRVAELRLGVGLQLLQDHRGDLLRRVLLALRLHAHGAVGAALDLVGDDLRLLGDLADLAAHEPLDRKDGVLGVQHRLPLGGGPDEPLVGVGERHDGRGGAVALGVLQHGGLAALHDRDARVRRAQVDSNGLRHIQVLLVFSFLSKSECEAYQIYSGTSRLGVRPLIRDSGTGVTLSGPEVTLSRVGSDPSRETPLRGYWASSAGTPASSLPVGQSSGGCVSRTSAGTSGPWSSPSCPA